MGSICANGADVRGSEFGFPATAKKVKGKEDEVQVMTEGGGKKSTSGSGDITAPNLLGQEIDNSGILGVPTAVF